MSNLQVARARRAVLMYSTSIVQREANRVSTASRSADSSIACMPQPVLSFWTALWKGQKDVALRSGLQVAGAFTCAHG